MRELKTAEISSVSGGIAHVVPVLVAVTGVLSILTYLIATGQIQPKNSNSQDPQGSQDRQGFPQTI